MKIGVITGTVVSTVKYERYRGMKMLKARNLTLEGLGHGLYRTGLEHVGIHHTDRTGHIHLFLNTVTYNYRLLYGKFVFVEDNVQR